MGLISAFCALCFLIFFHELGHYCAARICGVRVETFSIGFGKKLLRKSIGGTEYALSLIPLGGYVKLKGQDDLRPTARDNADDSYTTKPAYIKIIILSAGVVFNLLLAFLLYVSVALSGVQVLAPTIGSVQEHSPAHKAGLLQGDEIITIDSTTIASWEQMSDIIAQSSLDEENSTPQPLTFSVLRDGTIPLHFTITPRLQTYTNIFGEVVKKPMIGIAAKGDVNIAHYALPQALHFAFIELTRSSVLIFESLKKLIIGVIPLEQVGGVVGIVDVMAEIAPSGFSAFAMLVALISVNLAIINLLPIPALDGGQILFVCYEAVMKKPMSDRVLYALTLFGWAVLLSLMLLGVYNDVLRIITRSVQ